MEWRSVGLSSLYGALVLLTPQTSFAQLAHPGYSGLISTPNAEVLPQGQIALGYSWLDGPSTYLFAPKTNRIYVVTVGILPGLETTLRQTQVIGWHDPEAPGVQHAFDRMFSAKYAFSTPTGYPQVAIGMQDIASGNYLSRTRGARPGSTQYGQSMVYGVVGENRSNWSWHGGYGVSQAFINGIFAGISYNPSEQIKLLGEWDSRGINFGIQLTPLHGWRIQLSSISNATWGINSGLLITL
jgi:hypothetical protein